MAVRGDSREGGLLDDQVPVVRDISTDRRDSPCGSVAKRSFAIEQLLSFLKPVFRADGIQPHQQGIHRRTIAALRIVVPREALSQPLRLHASMPLQTGIDRD